GVLGGVALGSFVAGMQPHPTRVLGLVSFGAAGFALCLIIAAAVGVPGPALCVLLGVTAGLINVPLAATYQAALPPDARGNGMAVGNFADYLAVSAVSFSMYGLSHADVLSLRAELWLVATLAVFGALVAWWLLLRQTLELVVEFLVW